MENTNTTRKLTRRNAIMAALELVKHSAQTEQVCSVMGWTVDDFVKSLERAADASRNKRSGEPTATSIKNDALIRDVLIPFVRDFGKPVTSSIVRDNAGSPDILTASKATALIRRAVSQGLLEMSPYVSERVSKSGKVNKVNVAYQVPGFDWSDFEPVEKRSRKKQNAENDAE